MPIAPADHIDQASDFGTFLPVDGIAAGPDDQRLPVLGIIANTIMRYTYTWIGMELCRAIGSGGTAIETARAAHSARRGEGRKHGERCDGTRHLSAKCLEGDLG